MAGSRFLSQLSAVLQGRWQVPAALVAGGCLCAALYSLAPKPRAIDMNTVMADLQHLVEEEAWVAASDAAANLLEMEPLVPEQKAELHDFLADLIWTLEASRSDPQIENVEKLLDHHDAARALGQPATAHGFLRTATAHVWLDQPHRAIEAYRNALDTDPTPTQRRSALQGLVRLLNQRSGAKLERRRLLEALLADEGVSESYLWWGLQESIRDALDEGDAVRARLLLAQYGDRLRSSDLRGYLDYLWAWVMVHEGRPEEAAPIVQWVEDWLGEQPITTQELNENGDLPILNRWLQGKIHLAMDRPQDALEAFNEALQAHSDGNLFIGASVGRAEALAALERHSSARRAMEDAITRMIAYPLEARRGYQAFQNTLLRLFKSLREEGKYDEALGYLELAASMAGQDLVHDESAMLQRLGEAFWQAATETEDPERKRRYLLQAARRLAEAAEHNKLDEEEYASLLWSAAEAFDKAGRIGEARDLLLTFVEGRSRDQRLPRALLRLGQACEANGALREALRWYNRLIEEHPLLEEASRAKVYKAGCLVGLGQNEVPQAEALLVDVLDDDAITPEAKPFRDALLALCELLYQQGRYSEAISRLENFLTLYPEDEAYYQAAFLLADSYRQAAYTLRDHPPEDAPLERAQQQSSERFAQAARLFDTLLSDVRREADSAQLDRVAEYERLAMLNRADCLYELNEPELLQEALDLYGRTAARFERRPTALAAQTQIANIYLRMGMLTEAARAIERARWLLRSIPEEHFVSYGAGIDRAYWDHYLTALSASSLFGQVTGASR